MSSRHQDAVAIQQGACNPSGVARALVHAIDEAKAEGEDPRTCPACRLICHQLAFLLGALRYENGSDGTMEWVADMDAAEEKSR